MRTMSTHFSRSVFGIFVVLILGSTIAVAATPSANGKIAFTSDRDGNREIYTINPDGSSETRLTNNNLLDDHPMWSPDGHKIAFLGQRPTGIYAIFIMNPDGSARSEITPVDYIPLWQWYGWDGWAMSWSPNGQSIVFSNGNVHASTLEIVNIDGTNRRTLTSGFEPAWSPDGAKIVFLRETGSFGNTLLTIKPDGTDLRDITPKLTAGFHVTGGKPDWSPDSQKIAFNSFDGANMVIYLADADGSDPEVFALECVSDGGDSPTGCSGVMLPAWSPDGRSISFTNLGEIYTKELSGGDSIRVTASSGRNSNPDWQPLAALVSVSGRVTTPMGAGLRNALVTITDQLGVRRTSSTSTFGFYSFANVTAGETYTISVASRRYRFSPRTLMINNNLADIDFEGLE